MNYKSEADLQAQCYMWFSKEFPEQRNRYFLIYNNPPNAVVASKLKTMGLNRGIGDSLYMPKGRSNQWFEFKIRGGQSEPQMDFDILVTARGDEYHVIWELEEFQKIILNLNK
jgi:hypothetical protein